MPFPVTIRGARVHNLQEIDLEIPLDRWVIVTGRSGAGKSSLVFDTLHAEATRRYIETFSPYARQFLERIDRPDVTEIVHLPATVAVRAEAGARSHRETLGTVTEAYDLLRLLAAREATPWCETCGRAVSVHTPESSLRALAALPEGTRYLIGFPWRGETDLASLPVDDFLDWCRTLAQAGFVRLVVGTATRLVDDVVGLRAAFEAVVAQHRTGMATGRAEPRSRRHADDAVWVVVDRLVAGQHTSVRVWESLDTAFERGAGTCVVAVVDDTPAAAGGVRADRGQADGVLAEAVAVTIDGRAYRQARLSGDTICSGCGAVFPPREPRLFSFRSPLGACVRCAGRGVVRMSGDRGPSASNAPSECPDCDGTRLRAEARHMRLAGRGVGALCQCPASELAGLLRGASGDVADVSRERLRTQLLERLDLLADLGLGHVPLGRSFAALSSGEAHRARLVPLFAARVVNVAYLLEEPTRGLHPRDSAALVRRLRGLRDRGNGVIVIEHDPDIWREAELLIEIGPGAGPEGGTVVFVGPPRDVATQAPPTALLATYLAFDTGADADTEADTDTEGAESTASASAAASVTIAVREPSSAVSFPAVREVRSPTGWLALAGVKHRNLQGLDVRFPLGVVCAVTGVNGSGKSSLVMETLVPALRQELGRTAPGGDARRLEVGTWAKLSGHAAVRDVLAMDGRHERETARSNPASMLNVFPALRQLLAEGTDAKARHFTPRHFSLHAAEAGRCETCAGLGLLRVDMRFLADVEMICPDCRGTRYRAEVLDIRHRGLNVAEILDLTVQDGLTFFRGHASVQKKLKVAKDLGVGYVRLGQSGGSLSTGEILRLRLARHLASESREATLFVLDEPTAGLHPADVERLIAVFHELAIQGHSVVVIEHNLQLIAEADYVIDLGPEAGEHGGRVVAEGPPSVIAGEARTATAEALRRTLSRRVRN